MAQFADFLGVNKIKKKDMAEYLHVSNAFITQLSSGDRRLPPEKYALIKANNFGWDISMLEQESVQVAHGSIPTEQELIRLQAENEVLRKQLEWAMGLIEKQMSK